MNRSILIVICDFMVTSMIFLNGGFATVKSSHSGEGGDSAIDRATMEVILSQLQETSTALEAERARLIAQAGDSAEQNARISELTNELAATRAKIEYMERNARLSADEIGPLSAAQLQQDLDAEILVRNRSEATREQLELQLKMIQESLKRAEKQHSEDVRALENSSRNLADSNAALTKTQQELTNKSAETAALRERLSGKESTIAERNSAIAERDSAIAERETTIAARENDLANTRKSLGAAEASAKDYSERLNKVQNDLKYLQGRAVEMEKELADARDRAAAAEKTVRTRETELAATKAQLANQQKLVQSATNDRSEALRQLSEERTNREAAQQEVVKLTGDLNTANSKLKTAEELLRNDVSTRYKNSAVQLSIEIVEERQIVGEHREEATLFLPAVKIGGKTYIVSALCAFAGTRDKLGDVSKLAYRVSNASNKTKIELLPGPMAVTGNGRVALLEVPANLVAPLPLLTRDELTRRGTQDLYLFKAKSFGKDTADLKGSSSMNFEDGYLYVRNGGRDSSGIKAEVGDFVLTKQGELVAVVIAVDEIDRQLEARCYVFGKAPDVAKLPGVSLTRGANQKYYRDFSDKFNNWVGEAKTQNAKERRQ